MLSSMLASGSVPLRPREKLLSRGAIGLGDIELIALFLGSGVRGRSSLQVASGLLERAGGLRGLLLAGPASALRMHGIGPARYSRLQSALELARRVRRESAGGPPALGSGLANADSAGHVRQRLIDVLTDLCFQGFAIAFENRQGECIGCERLFRGTLEHVHIHPREIVRRALALKAAHASVARGDPEGTPEVTASDLSMQAQLRRALATVDVSLRCHYVVGQSGQWLEVGGSAAAALRNALPPAHERAPQHEQQPQQLALDLSFPACS